MSDNPFEILNIEPAFAIDERTLQQNFIKATAANHPDRFSDPFDQADAADRAARITQAHRTLRDPELRARVLYRMLSGSEVDESKAQVAPDVLMELMEAREELDAAHQNGDEQAVKRIADGAQADRKTHLQKLASLFSDATTAEGEQLDALLTQVRDELHALRYVQRLIEQAG